VAELTEAEGFTFRVATQAAVATGANRIFSVDADHFLEEAFPMVASRRWFVVTHGPPTA
jgi:hypothetical protein